MKSVTFPSAGPVAPVNGRVALHYIPVQRRIDNSPEKIPGKPEKAKKNIVENPVDLTGNPQLAQRHEEPLAEKTNAKPVRRVYGLQKVYSRGLGTSGAMADAIIGKRGNTLAKEFYTLNATAEHIKGRVVSATTVTKAPAFRKKVPPEYTKEMIDNRVEGVVKVKVLVDIDGRVKQATAINDLGFETASRALKAILETLFFPALRDDEPVAVWIVVPIRFIMIG
jgi:TonB family protein